MYNIMYTHRKKRTPRSVQKKQVTLFTTIFWGMGIKTTYQDQKNYY